MSDHARFSPSAAHRWSICPGSIVMEEQCESTGSSAYADEGTDAHDLAAFLLEMGGKASEFCGRYINNRTFVDEEFAEHVQTYVDRVLAEADPLMLLFIEQRVDFSETLGEPDCFGTADAVIIDLDLKYVQIHDLKFGKGVKVEAEDNDQQKLYAIGIYEMVRVLDDMEIFEFFIHQPRLDHLSIWTTDRESLLEDAEVYKEAVKQAKQPDPPLNANEKACRFCKAFARCPEAQRHAFEVLSEDFGYVEN